MFSPLRNRFGIPGVISVIALVFAMLGGAYAASDNGASGKATASAVKQGPPGPRGKRGKPGPAGPQGPAGPAGAKGDKGDTGTPGSNGSNGAAGATGLTGPKGATGATGASGAKGATGPTGPTGTFDPNGFTQTGVWASSSQTSGIPTVPKESSVLIPISFPIPLAGTPTFVAVKAGEDKSAQGCDGTVEASQGHLEGGAPLADPGKVCVYLMSGELFSGPVTLSAQDPSKGGFGSAGTSTGGILLKAECGTPPFGETCNFVRGMWAVTG